MNFNEKLDVLLRRNHIKRAEFAVEMGITYRALAYYMSGVRKPRRRILEKMAERLEVTSEFLADDTADMELTVEEKFLHSVSIKGLGIIEAEKFIAQSKGLFAGNTLSDEDKGNLIACLTEIYNDSRKDNNGARK